MKQPPKEPPADKLRRETTEEARAYVVQKVEVAISGGVRRRARAVRVVDVDLTVDDLVFSVVSSLVSGEREADRALRRSRETHEKVVGAALDKIAAAILPLVERGRDLEKEHVAAVGYPWCGDSDVDIARELLELLERRRPAMSTGDVARPIDRAIDAFLLPWREPTGGTEGRRVGGWWGPFAAVSSAEASVRRSRRGSLPTETPYVYGTKREPKAKDLAVAIVLAGLLSDVEWARLSGDEDEALSPADVLDRLAHRVRQRLVERKASGQESATKRRA